MTTAQSHRDTLSLVIPVKSHEESIRRITSDQKVMRWVANGKVWNRTILDKFFKYCYEESKLSPEKRSNHYYSIIHDKECVGVVGIQRMYYDRQEYGTPALRIFLDSGRCGKGLGKIAVCTALRNFWSIFPRRAVLIDVREDNHPMNRLMEKLDIYMLYKTTIAGRTYKRYKAYPGVCYSRFESFAARL